MSSMAIVAIACDRYRCVMQTDRPQLTSTISVKISIAMACISVTLAAPLFYGAHLSSFSLEFPDALVCTDTRSGTRRYVNV